MAESIHDALIARLKQSDQGLVEATAEDVSEDAWAAKMAIVAARAKQELALEEDQEETAVIDDVKRRPVLALAGGIAGMATVAVLLTVNVALGWLAIPAVLSGVCVVAGLVPTLGHQVPTERGYVPLRR